MPGKKQIWYCRGSRATLIVNRLRGRYAVRALTTPDAGFKSHAQTAASDDGATHAVCLADLKRDDLDALHKLAREHPGLRLIGVLANPAARDSGTDGHAHLFAYLPLNASRTLVEKTIQAAFEHIGLAERERQARAELEQARCEMEELNQIGVALSATRDVKALLDLILEKSRLITRADAGSLYLVEEAGEGKRRLRFKLTQNDSVQFPFAEYTMPLTEESTAGYVALHGEVLALEDAYAIPPGRPYEFNLKFDQESGYRTRSVLTLPMKNARGEVLGVLQLLNSKRNPAARLTSPAAVRREVQPFTERAVRLGLSLASQAAVAYENSRLYQDIETLFEGFVQAAVTAIEQRDPTTSGHSQRVSKLTVGLAECVDRTGAGIYAGVRFTPEQMKEVRYAALLHDFGKVGVREEVLVKAKKFYPGQLALVQNRFDYVRKELEARTERRKLRILLDCDREEALAKIRALDEEFHRHLAELEDYFQVILEANEPTVLPEGRFERLLDIAWQTYQDPRGVEHNLLTPEEVRLLSIPKGSLDENERLQIEAHVAHSFRFLLQIPWTKELNEIPRIVRAHHEKLDGSGYPYKLKRDEIPLQAKIMTICDIFDALSASDRPYKKAVPHERALAILEASVRSNELDAELFKLFLEAKIYQLVRKSTD